MLKRAEGNEVICASIEKAAEILPQFKNIACSISGGKDSDIMLDLIWNLDTDKKVRYIWFDTGMEYKATKDHLKYLEDKYNIAIEKIKAIKSIPKSVKEYGQPFVSKNVSETIYGMQKRGFQFEDGEFADLANKYPDIMSYVRWWVNGYQYDSSLYNIEYNKYLKEFMTTTPRVPNFSALLQLC